MAYSLSGTPLELALDEHINTFRAHDLNFYGLDIVVKRTDHDERPQAPKGMYPREFEPKPPRPWIPSRVKLPAPWREWVNENGPIGGGWDDPEEEDEGEQAEEQEPEEEDEKEVTELPTRRHAKMREYFASMGIKGADLENMSGHFSLAVYAPLDVGGQPSRRYTLFVAFRDLTLAGRGFAGAVRAPLMVQVEGVDVAPCGRKVFVRKHRIVAEPVQDFRARVFAPTAKWRPLDHFLKQINCEVRCVNDLGARDIANFRAWAANYPSGRFNFKKLPVEIKQRILRLALTDLTEREINIPLKLRGMNFDIERKDPLRRFMRGVYNGNRKNYRSFNAEDQDLPAVLHFDKAKWFHYEAVSAFFDLAWLDFRADIKILDQFLQRELPLVLNYVTRLRIRGTVPELMTRFGFRTSSKHAKQPWHQYRLIRYMPSLKHLHVEVVDMPKTQQGVPSGEVCNFWGANPDKWCMKQAVDMLMESIFPHVAHVPSVSFFGMVRPEQHARFRKCHEAAHACFFHDVGGIDDYQGCTADMVGKVTAGRSDAPAPIPPLFTMYADLATLNVSCRDIRGTRTPHKLPTLCACSTGCNQPRFRGERLGGWGKCALPTVDWENEFQEVKIFVPKERNPGVPVEVQGKESEGLQQYRTGGQAEAFPLKKYVRHLRSVHWYSPLR